jgi:hypothetical protein
LHQSQRLSFSSLNTLKDMSMKNLFSKGIFFLSFIVSTGALAQVPTADFTVSPNPVCSGTNHLVQITDLSTGSPTAWSYTVSAAGPGGPTVYQGQNQSIFFNMPGTYTVTLIASNTSGASTAVSHTVMVLPSPVGQMAPSSQTTCAGSNPLSISIITGGPGAASTTFSWSTGSTTNSITVTPSVTTTYTCVMTGTNGCTTERTSTVVISQPTISITSNPVFICPGSSSTLTATGTNPGPFTYSWSTAATTRTISSNTAGVYSVTVTNANNCTAVQFYTLSTSTTLSLSIISNPPILCAGNTGTLRATGASSYSWSTGSGAANTTVAPITSTTYTVNGQFGTCSGSTTITYSVNVTPTVVAVAVPSAICAGDTATLTGGGASTYTWMPGDIHAQSITVSPFSNSSYTVRGTNPGCPTRTTGITLIVMQKPVITVTSSSVLPCAGEVVALAANGAASYTWDTGSNNAILIVTPTVTTTYTVTGATSGCENSAAVTQSVSDCVGLSENTVKEITLQLFPNPNNGSFKMSASSSMEISVSDQTGRLIRTIQLNAGEIYSVNGFSAGIYYASGATIRQKIIVLSGN